MTSSPHTSRRAFLGTAGALAFSGIAAPETRSGLVRFGSTDLWVSRLCQGTAFRKIGRTADDPDAQVVLRRCLDLGVNFFDSSNAYGWGGSELALGKAIRGRRDKVVICTKVSPGLKPEPGAAAKRTALSRDFIFTQVEGSLKRLGTDVIDIYMLHSPDHVTPSEQLADTMDALVRAGKIRYWGASNFDSTQVAEFVELGRRKGKAPIAGLEDYYNIVAAERRRFMEDRQFPVIRQGRLGLLAFSPLAEGRLAPDRPVDAAWQPVVQALDEVAREMGATRPQVCIAWVLSHPEVTSALAGAERPEHVDDNVGGTRIVLTPEAIRKLNAASDAVPGKTA